jgi:gliding motility-associated-like protein
VGGEMFYDHLGGDSFEITLYIYVDCENGRWRALLTDRRASIGIYSSTDNSFLDSITITRIDSTVIKDVNYNCLEPPSNICVRRYEFRFIKVLKDIPGGYTIAYQRCCRNRTVLNVFDQNSTGGTYFTIIPERKNLGNNSSPRFKALPPNFLCLNSAFEFKHNAVDPDGDSLVYELCLPYEGGSTFDPAPDPPNTAPPYQNVTMNAGFGVNNFMNANPRLTIKRKTGLLTCTPRRLGQYVVGVCVKEYRNGVLLSTTLRDFQFNVINCQFDVVSSFTTPEQQCDYEVKFKNESQGAIAYKWNFGDTTTKADTSDKETESYTYKNPGWVTVKLIAYSKECNDTFLKTFYVKPDTGAFAGPDARSCNGEPVIIGPRDFFPKSKYQWFPSAFLSSDTARNPTANPPTDRSYVLRQTFDYCFAYDTVLVKNGPPDIDFNFTPLIECKNLTYRFETTGEGRDFSWNFGTGRQRDVSTLQDLYFTFPKEGVYDVKYIASLNPSCKDSMIESIIVVEDTTDFAGPSQLVCFGDSIQIGRPPIKPGLRYSWVPDTFLDANNVPRPYVKPEITITYYITRTADYCEVEDSITLTVDKPEPFFKMAYTFPCDGLNVKVYNSSKNCSKLFWDFGVTGSTRDTSTSLDSVAFKFPDNGEYNISLKGTSAKGCEWIYERELNVFADTAEFAGPDSNLCKGQELEIGLKDSISFARFKWVPADSVSNATIPNPIITPKDSGVYVLRKVYPECTFSDTIFVGVHDPLADFSTDYDPHCDVFEIALANNNKRFDRVLWDFGHEAFEDLSDTVRSTFPGPGTYDIKVFTFKEQCIDTTTKKVTAYVDTGVTIIPDSVICTGDEIVLGATDTAKTAKHLWTPSFGLDNDTIPNPKANPTATTIYTYQRIFEKCTYEGIITVRVAEPVAGFDTTVTPDCYGYKAEFVNTSTASEKYEWSFSNNKTSTNTNEEQLFDYGSELKALLIAIDAHCRDTFQIIQALTPFDSFEVFRPNIFTPNGDGFNDCYRIEIPKLPADCKNFDVTFFNRWGQEMFTIEQEGNVLCWDGTNAANGVPVNNGVYYYIIKVLNREFTGAIHIIR